MDDKNQIIIDNLNILECPNCKYNYLHQEQVITEWRYEEDDDGLQTITSKNQVQTKNALSSEIDGRRDNIYIQFWCEDCHNKPTIQISQYKGQTYIQWIKKISNIL